MKWLYVGDDLNLFSNNPTLWEKASEYAKQNKSIIFDMGFWRKESRKESVKKTSAVLVFNSKGEII